MKNKNMAIILAGLIIILGIGYTYKFILINLNTKNYKYHSNFERKEMYPLDSVRYKFL